MNTYTILFIITVIGFGCQGQTHVNTPKQAGDTIPARVIEVRVAVRGDTALVYHEMRSLEKELGLDKLVNGYDSLQIRIRLSFSFDPKSQLIIISSKRDEWQAEVIDLVTNRTDSSVDIKVTGQNNLVPRSGWVNFSKGLDELAIQKLPDYNYVPGGYVNTDEDFADVEYATAEYYKVIAYPLRSDPSKFSEPERQFEKILSYLESELGFTRYKMTEK